jgi:hypothetical protein
MAFFDSHSLDVGTSLQFVYGEGRSLGASIIAILFVHVKMVFVQDRRFI